MKPRWGVIVFAVIALTAPRPAQANFKNNIIFSGCAAAMRKEYQQANKQLLLSQLNKTCDYVVKQINNRKILNKPKLLASI
ncbi:MAG: hypothetical protein HF560_03790 [Synechococcus sp. MIT S9220]|uniref:hypothetical protein n=1 Tax=unclassified Synechococcus TaxID=2626047 RepID=UPI00164AEA60|nr:hypothetical protein [Synechococcus sp. MIT S9220]NOL46687.1 hypothetical protein [Synechococcus sp. MIT S9220]